MMFNLDFNRRDLVMPAIEVGRICLKLAGRESGKKCIIIEVIDKGFVMITGPKKVTGVKRRRASTNHIAPLKDKIGIKRGSSDEEVTQALTTAGKLDEMNKAVECEH
jgi:large subunit ribosomal protein L14e